MPASKIEALIRELKRVGNSPGKAGMDGPFRAAFETQNDF